MVASGEQVTSGLLAIALQDIGVKARSWQGWQIPIRTDGAHGAARIAEIDGATLIERLRAGAGGGGLRLPGHRARQPHLDARARRLGHPRGRASPAAINADRCDIYTDVDGVYTTDPRIVPKARRLTRVSFEEMLEMASLGAKVLQVRSVELAMVHRVRTFVRSSFDDPEPADRADGSRPER